VCLVAITALAYAIIAPLAYHLHGYDGLRAAGVACLVCLVGAVVALFVSDAFQNEKFAFAGVLVGTAARMVLPMLTCGAVCWRGGPLAEAGMAFYLVVFYMIILAVETWVAVGRTGGAQAVPGDSRMHP
jgi:hypothetical protein